MSCKCVSFSQFYAVKFYAVLLRQVCLKWHMEALNHFASLNISDNVLLAVVDET